MTMGNTANTFCSDRMSSSHFIVKTSKCLLIDATATLRQGHGKVIQYILTDPYIICSNYLRFSENGFDVKIKIVAADAADTCDTAGTNWKHKVAPDRMT